MLANEQCFSNFFLFFERRNWNLNAQEIWYAYLFPVTDADYSEVQVLLNEDVGLEKQPVKITVQFNFRPIQDLELAIAYQLLFLVYWLKKTEF